MKVELKHFVDLDDEEQERAIKSLRNRTKGVLDGFTDDALYKMLEKDNDLNYYIPKTGWSIPVSAMY